MEEMIRAILHTTKNMLYPILDGIKNEENIKERKKQKLSRRINDVLHYMELIYTPYTEDDFVIPTPEPKSTFITLPNLIESSIYEAATQFTSIYNRNFLRKKIDKENFKVLIEALENTNIKKLYEILDIQVHTLAEQKLSLTEDRKIRKLEILFQEIILNALKYGKNITITIEPNKTTFENEYFYKKNTNFRFEGRERGGSFLLNHLKKLGVTEIEKNDNIYKVTINFKK